ncbi:MAG: carboxymuconolactone decarboxylase family protein [Gammaproteobacteria bacterium]|jgi:4-carboxymuconolactone decarboxylase|nr:carboxymuconolactone decarboxylase family protein [Gammaproteobacteria bacterium]NCF80470.1 carboxymuconolactone decarboxylase family protein [Pseudomonadota bacterium]
MSTGTDGTSDGTTGRLPELAHDSLGATGRALFDAITGGKRNTGKGPSPHITPGGGLRGPFNALLYAPHVGDPAQRLGERLRFDGILSPRQREIGVLCVAAHWRADYEWWAHARIASECGVCDGIIEAIRQGAQPPLDAPDERLVHDYSRALLNQHQISDDLYRDTVAALGEAALVELVVLLGYYSLISMVLVSFQVPLPEGEAPPFGD